MDLPHERPRVDPTTEVGSVLLWRWQELHRVGFSRRMIQACRRLEIDEKIRIMAAWRHQRTRSERWT